jgi:hypothetical protein
MSLSTRGGPRTDRSSRASDAFAERRLSRGGLGTRPADVARRGPRFAGFSQPRRAAVASNKNIENNPMQSSMAVAGKDASGQYLTRRANQRHSFILAQSARRPRACAGPQPRRSTRICVTSNATASPATARRAGPIRRMRTKRTAARDNQGKVGLPTLEGSITRNAAR